MVYVYGYVYTVRRRSGRKSDYQPDRTATPIVFGDRLDVRSRRFIDLSETIHRVGRNSVSTCPSSVVAFGRWQRFWIFFRLLLTKWVRYWWTLSTQSLVRKTNWLKSVYFILKPQKLLTFWIHYRSNKKKLGKSNLSLFVNCLSIISTVYQY